jgi:hypothetical protein
MPDLPSLAESRAGRCQVSGTERVAEVLRRADQADASYSAVTLLALVRELAELVEDLTQDQGPGRD